MSDFYIRLAHIKLLGKYPLLQKAALTLYQDGWAVFIHKTKTKLRNIYRKRIRNRIQNTLIKRLIENPPNTPYEAYIYNNEINPSLYQFLSVIASRFAYQPLISILMPVYNVEPHWLSAAINSVKNQIYTNWELCIADDASTNQATRELLESYQNEKKIKLIFRKRNGNICAASNSAAELAQGEFVAFIDDDDLLAPHALFEIVRALQDNRECDLLYSDEDKIDENNNRYEPQFKPDWSPELFLSYNYINHLTCLRRVLFEEAGRFRIGYEGAQDYDLLLRVIEKTNKIRHIPKVLYHWRSIKGSTALEAKAKPIMQFSARRGLQDHLQRQNIRAEIYQPDFAQRIGLPIYQLDWPDQGPSIAIIIPTFNHHKWLKKCIESIIKITTYKNYKIIIIDNDSNDEKTLTYLKQVAKKGIRVERICNDGQPFSFSRINNLAVQRVNTDYVLFLNNDTVISEPKWLSRLAGYLSLPVVGVVGARLLYPNYSIQHAGVVLCMHDGIIPDHAFINRPSCSISYFFLAEVARNCSAVTGACLMTRRTLFLEMGGFNDQDFKVSLQDVDYCLRFVQKGLRTVYVAGAELIHHQSMSRQREDDPRELAQFRKLYYRHNDPFYNTNLSKIDTFAPDTICGLADYSTFLTKSLKIMIFTHSLELSGAPKAMYDLATGLKADTDARITPIVISPVAGPFQSAFERTGIQVKIIDLHTKNIAAGWETKNDYDSAIRNVETVLENEKPDVLITNTVYGFYAIQAGRSSGFPVIWIISESFTHQELKRYLNDFTLTDCLISFSHAFRVVFGSQGTRNYYESFNSRFNFQVIHNSIDHKSIDQFMAKVSKEEAREYLQMPLDKKIILMVGTICERKGQVTLVEAIANLQNVRHDFCCYLVGANEKVAFHYLKNIRDLIRYYKLNNTVKIISETEELYWYYRASDFFVFTSLMECYPLSILEAMAFGLPIVTTPCCGVTEQVRSVNALFFNTSNSKDLAKNINVLLNDMEKIKYLGRNSKAISEYQQTYQEMIKKYKHLIYSASFKRNNNV